MMQILQRFIFFSIVAFILAANVEGQVNRKKGPADGSDVLSSVLYQEGSPLKIESVQSVLEAKRLNTYYSVRNTGLKPIKYYRIAHWFSDNTGYVLPGAMPSTDVLGPNATFSIRSKKIQALAVPASTNSYKIIGFSMIVEVGFVDGTSLSFENDFKELEAHLRLFESVYDRDLTDKRAAHR